MWIVPADVQAAIVADCVARRPDEACGLLLGRARRIERAVPVENVWPDADERAHRYSIDPLTQVKAESLAAAEGIDLIGFYHSHPTARAVPSQFDTERAWPMYVYLIVGLSDIDYPEFRAWALDAEGAFVEHPVRSNVD